MEKMHSDVRVERVKLTVVKILSSSGCIIQSS